MDAYKIPDRDGAAGRLRKRSKFVAEQRWPDPDYRGGQGPEASATLVNGYADELFVQNNRLAIGAASQRRQFFQQQLARGEGPSGGCRELR